MEKKVFFLFSVQLHNENHFHPSVLAMALEKIDIIYTFLLFAQEIYSALLIICDNEIEQVPFRGRSVVLPSTLPHIFLFLSLPFLAPRSLRLRFLLVR